MKLPTRLLDTETLENMKVGDRRFTMPWAMWVDSDMECWLHPCYPAEKRPHGTAQMAVRLAQRYALAACGRDRRALAMGGRDVKRRGGQIESL